MGSQMIMLKVVKLKYLQVMKELPSGVVTGALVLPIIAAMWLIGHSLVSQIAYWLRYGSWIDRDLIWYLKYVIEIPHTGWGGVDQIIKYVVTTHAAIIGFFLILISFIGAAISGGSSIQRERLYDKQIAAIKSDIETEQPNLPDQLNRFWRYFRIAVVGLLAAYIFLPAIFDVAQIFVSAGN